MVDRIQAARTDGTDGIVLNPGGWTHYSVAIRDALLGVSIPYIEVNWTFVPPFSHHRVRPKLGYGMDENTDEDVLGIVTCCEYTC